MRVLRRIEGCVARAVWQYRAGRSAAEAAVAVLIERAAVLGQVSGGNVVECFAAIAHRGGAAGSATGWRRSWGCARQRCSPGRSI